jgi:hypothetical protein
MWLASRFVIYWLEAFFWGLLQIMQAMTMSREMHAEKCGQPISMINCYFPKSN